MSWTSAQINQAHDILTQQYGLSSLGASALISRWSNVESGSAANLSVNSSSGATGIAQWLGSRLSNLNHYADSTGGSPSDFVTQVNFAGHELQTTESGAFNALQNAQTPEQAATGASMFERAEGYNPATGMDNFTGSTATGIPGIQSSITGNTASDPNAGTDYGLGGSNTFDNSGYNVSAGDPAAAGSDTFDFTGQGAYTTVGDYSQSSSSLVAGTTGSLKNPSVGSGGQGATLTDAVNALVKQSQADTAAQTATDTANTKATTAATAGLVTSLESLTSNLFVRGGLIAVGSLFILAAVLGLAFGSGHGSDIAQGVVVAKKSLKFA